MRKSDMTKSRFSFSKKAFSALVSLVMLVAMIPANALAAGDPVVYPEQIVSQETDFLKPGGDVSMRESIKYVTDEDGKRIENLFDVTVEVKTPKKVEEISISPNAAVSLVLDLSGSMENNFDGKKKLNSMKDAVKNFLDGYATGNADVIRNVSIVVFATHGATLTGWVDINQGNNLAALKTMVSNLTIGDNGATIGGNDIGRSTNLTAGLMLSKNLITDLITANGASYASTTEGKYNIYSIAFTDGDVKYSTKDNSDSRTFIAGTGNNMNTTRAQSQGNAIKELGATTMAVAYGDTSTSIYSYCNGPVISAKNVNELELAFEQFNDFIEMTTKLWTVELPFAAPVEYVGVVLEDGSAQRTNLTNNTFTWDLTKDIPNFSNNLYSYTKTVRVRLNTLSDTFEAGEDFDATVTRVTANDVVTTSGSVLYYTPYDDVKGEYEETARVGAFTVPTVEGFADDISFKKVDDKGSSVSGVSFTLKKGSFTMTAVSGVNGLVTFEDVPSGHDYVITEDGFGAGEANASFAGTYERNTTPINATVSWGDATITSGLNASDAYVNNRVKNVTVKVNYYKNNVTTPDDNATFLGTATFTEKFLPGDEITLTAGTAATQLNQFKPDKFKDGAQQGTKPYVVTGENDVINVLYLAEEYSVIVNYYKDNVTNPSDEDTYLGTATFSEKYVAGDTITLAAGTAATQLNQFKPDYYKNGVQQGTTPYVVTGEGDVINVLYVAEEYTVKVNYYKDEVTTPSDIDTYLGTATFTQKFKGGETITLGDGTDATQLNFMKPDYYQAGVQQGTTPYVVTGENDVIDVLYAADTFPVTVRYYKDAVTTPDDEDTFLGEEMFDDEFVYGAKITLDDGTSATQLDFLRPDYYQAGVQQGDTPYVVTAEDDVINVLYVKETFPVTVNYYKDTVTNPDDEDTFLGTFTFDVKFAYGDKITLADGTTGGQLNFFKPDYYQSGTQQDGTPYVVTGDGDVINVLYVEDEPIIIEEDEPPLYIPDEEPPLVIPDETPPLTGDSTNASLLAFALISSAFAAGFVWKKKAKKDS